MANAEKYNEGKAGTLWDWSQLPPHMRDHRANPTAFAKRVRVFQGQHGLVADGKLGPKTMAAIWVVWPALEAGALPAPAPPKKAKKAKAAKAAKADEPDGVLLVDGKEEPVPLP